MQIVGVPNRTSDTRIIPIIIAPDFNSKLNTNWLLVAVSVIVLVTGTVLEIISLQFQLICLESSVVESFEFVVELVLELLSLVDVVLDTVEVLFKSFSEVVIYSLVAVSNSADKLFRDVVVQRVVIVVFAVLEVLIAVGIYWEHRFLLLAEQNRQFWTNNTKLILWVCLPNSLIPILEANKFYIRKSIWK